MITTGVFQGNEKSMRLLNKLGFVKEGITHKAGIVDRSNYYKMKSL